MVDVVILCGGKGTRAYPDTLELPKPLLPVAGVPVVEHVMRIYANQGHRRFVLAAGYLGDLIEERYATPPPGLEVEVVHTGNDTETGERIRRAAEHVRGDRFFATYADGVGDVGVNALLQTHLAADALATVTTVPLPSQYGVLESDGDGRITRFREKPRLDDHWINGGFFVFEKEAFRFWEGQVLESEVLPAISAAGGLYVYRHRGFWKSMDTYKDRQELDSLAAAGAPPWDVPVTVSLSLAIADKAWVRASANGSEESRSTLALAGGRGSATRTTVPTLEPSDASKTAATVGAPPNGGRRTNVDPGPLHDRRDGRPHSAPPDRHGRHPKRLPRPAPTLDEHAEAVEAFAPPPRRRAARRLAVVTAATALLDLAAVVVAYAFVASIQSGPLASRLVGSDRAELLVTAPVWLLLFASTGLYDRRRLVAASEEVRRLLQAITVGAVGVVLLTFALNQDVGRSWVAVLAMAILVFVGASRAMVRSLVQLLAARGVIGTRVLVVGANDEAHAIARTLDRQRWLGYYPVGLVAAPGDVVEQDGFPVVGTLDEVVDAVERLEVGAAVVASTAVGTEPLADLCARLHRLGVDVRVSPGLPYVAANRISVEPLDGLAMLSVRPGELTRSQRFAKRLVDLAVGTALLAVAAPLIAVLALAVRLTSGGPSFFRQIRVGEGGRPFVLHKLRTMHPGAEELVVDLRSENAADGLLFKLSDDPRVTRLGSFLRRWGLDELPQLWNVVKGDMSLVGPRPPLPDESRRYDEWVRGRLRVKPGITGLWQVNGGHQLRFDDYVRYDLFYVENWSLGLDLYVIARTPGALLFRRGLT